MTNTARLRHLRLPGRTAARRVTTGLASLAMVGGALVVVASPASADPSSNAWYRLRMCESSDNYSIDTGNAHYGAYQFDLSTWRSVGGAGNPAHASKAEQDARALILYRERGWQPWQCASILGLREDGDAGSGYIKDIVVPGSASKPAGSQSKPAKPKAPPAARKTPAKHKPAAHPATRSTSAPAFPGGSHWYTYGETSKNIKVLQDQMHKRGYFPVGTGEYGPNTQKMVKQLQRLNGLVPNGLIGPNTWRMAWTGRYAAPGTGSTPAIPKFPGGANWYYHGQTNKNIKVFQDQMHKRGYFPVGTGEFGPNTLRMVKQLQKLNGLTPNGYLGPNTWKLAWVGTYHN